MSSAKRKKSKKKKTDRNAGRRTSGVSKRKSGGRPLVTVGLPVYNGAKYLSEAIESILNQDFEDFELIISDNASTDGTADICTKYRRLDKRVRYVRQSRNVGAVNNFEVVLGLSDSPFFMWASHDDLREASCIRKCLEVHQKDESVVLVYPQTKLLDSESRFQGVPNDFVKADQEDPAERFKHLIWEIGLCNMFFGVFRSDALKNAESWGKSLFSDNLLLAEMALAGKIVQIPEPLFIRRLTRDYNYKSLDHRNAQLISDCLPSLFNEGICFPYCRLAYAHLDLVNNSSLEKDRKERLLGEVITCFRSRFGNHIKYEIDRAVHFISKGVLYWTWRNDPSEAAYFIKSPGDMEMYRVSNLIKHIQEALLIAPERKDLLRCYEKCLGYFVSARTVPSPSVVKDASQ